MMNSIRRVKNNAKYYGLKITDLLNTDAKKRSHIRKQFIESVGYEPNFDDPKTINEKTQWLKLNYKDRLITECADKVRMRNYVTRTVGGKYVNKSLGVYERFEDIDFSKLPKRFVLKTNNSSGKNIICNDKSKLDLGQVKQQLDQWMRPEVNHYYYSYEWSYKNIKPKIICEEFIKGKEGKLRDYKFLCFNGDPKLMFVCTDRSSKLRLNYFTPDWSEVDLRRHSYQPEKPSPKQPVNFKEMLKIAKKLSAPFPFVRVDLYDTTKGIKCGELTFYPNNGVEAYDPVEWDYTMGSWLTLPKKDNLKTQ